MVVCKIVSDGVEGGRLGGVLDRFEEDALVCLGGDGLGEVTAPLERVVRVLRVRFAGGDVAGSGIDLRRLGGMIVVEIDVSGGRGRKSTDLKLHR